MILNEFPFFNLFPESEQKLLLLDLNIMSKLLVNKFLQGEHSDDLCQKLLVKNIPYGKTFID